jgi:hypothetical protein
MARFSATHPHLQKPLPALLTDTPGKARNASTTEEMPRSWISCAVTTETDRPYSCAAIGDSPPDTMISSSSNVS